MLVDKLKIIASTDSTVMITGDSGTGKELFARTIHNLSHRKNNSFVAINCGAIPTNLLESELFGYKKGAFTGAYTDKIGFFEEASHGTIFLDEIGEVEPQFQVKLLRVLQEGEVMPVGSNRPVKVNARVIAATNKNLRQSMAKGEFRKDLYYRLNVIQIEIPPLQERKEDIPLLANYFLAKYSEKYKKNLQGFSESAIGYLIKHPWPGNVRELENAMERAVILSKGNVIDVPSLPTEITDKTEIIDFGIQNYKKAKRKF